MAAAQAPAHPVLDFTFNAGADMSAASSVGGPGPSGSYQYAAVKYTSNDIEVAPSSSYQTKTVAGVLQNMPTLNGAAQVRMQGITKLVVDGSTQAITPGMTLTTDSVGRGVTSSSAVPFFAIALQGSTAQGDIISAFLVNNVPV